MTCRRLALGLVCFLALTVSVPAEEPTAATTANTPEAPPARLKVAGCGLLENRRRQQDLKILQAEKQAPPFYSTDFVEDAATLLLGSLRDDGWLQAEVQARLTLRNGALEVHRWGLDTPPTIPQPIEAQAVRFQVRRGVRFFYQSLEFEGLRVLEKDEARRFFIPTESLIRLRGFRVFSPAGLRRGISSLTDALELKGYLQAAVAIEEDSRNPTTGAVRIRIRVQEGLPTVVGNVRVHISRPDVADPEERTLPGGMPYSRFWQQDLVRRLRTEQSQHGHLDVQVNVSTSPPAPGGTNQVVEVEARVDTGPVVRLGQVRLEGLQRTRPSIVRRRIPLPPGEPINAVAAESARQRLYRLGILDHVELHFAPDAPAEVRDAVFELKEGRDMEVNLLLGYGSYEMLRGGAEFEWNNLFGLAHGIRLRGLKSFKSTAGNALYTVPEILGEDLTASAEAKVLLREEISFDREEYGGSAGLSRFLPPLRSTIGLRYNLEFLRATDVHGDLPSSFQESRVAGFIFDFKHDGRDNPVMPRRGFKLFGNLEVSSDALGANVEYQRLEVSSAWHHQLPWTQILHLGIGHGVAFTPGDPADELPLNRRFFPGGENTVRGYQYGEAAPRNASGDLVGAETYLLGNLELEQPLTPHWSVVAFLDAVGVAEHLDDYPFDEVLWSVGGGIRLRTVVGPVRLEYGYNPDPRPDDPQGTIQFSFGFPF